MRDLLDVCLLYTSPAVSPSFATLLDSLDDVCSEMRYFGSYTEVL